ncbi:MAG: hypothetical protein JO118_10845, partial [Acetobacteraceae bacterium]|nr:hypothetical protein [Acetobacteraceae bacterium]
WPETAQGRLSTTADALKRGAPALPPGPARVVTELLLPYKMVEKRLSAFGPGLQDHIHPRTGRIHAHFHLAGTVTGRMSASEPNLQQVPRECEFRRLFKAPPGSAFEILRSRRTGSSDARAVALETSQPTRVSVSQPAMSWPATAANPSARTSAPAIRSARKWR